MENESNESPNWFYAHFKLWFFIVFAVFVVATVLLLIREYSFMQTCSECVRQGFCLKEVQVPINWSAY